MYIILFIALYFLTSLALIAMGRSKLPFRASWLVAVLTNLVLWTGLLLLRLWIPTEVSLAAWETQGGYQINLLLDSTSWSFAFAIATLNLAGILTDLARPDVSNWRTWAASCGLTGLGVLAVLSENPLTLVLAWVAIDLAELVIRIEHNLTNPTRERFTISTFIRITGSFLVVSAVLLTSAAESKSLLFETSTSLINLSLLAGAALRLGLLPFFPPQGKGADISRGLVNSLRFIPAASSLLLVTRVANEGGVNEWLSISILVCGVIAAFSAVRWFSATDEVEGSYYWVMGMCSLAFASALKAQPVASLAWSLGLLLPGGLLLLASQRNRLTLPLGIISMVMISSLPFTPTWNGLLLYTPPYQFGLIFLLVAQAILIAGFARQFFIKIDTSNSNERWTRVIYMWGLVILLLVYLVIGYWQELLWPGPTGVVLLSLLFMAILGGLMIFFSWRKLQIPKRWGVIIDSLFSFKWLQQTGNYFFHFLRRITEFTSLILEGEGGVLWSLLFLVLLLSALLSAGVGR